MATFFARRPRVFPGFRTKWPSDRPPKSRSGMAAFRRSILAEAAIELPVVAAVHVAVAVEIAEPQVVGVTDVVLERGAEDVAVCPIHVAVAVAVAEQADNRRRAVAAGDAIAVA